MTPVPTPDFLVKDPEVRVMVAHALIGLISALTALVGAYTLYLVRKNGRKE